RDESPGANRRRGEVVMTTTLRRFARPLLGSAVLFLLGGCTAADLMEIQTRHRAPALFARVWFDSGCPQYNIRALSWAEDYRAAQATACGRIRRYQDTSGHEQEPNWLDTTALVEGGGVPLQEAPAPAPVPTPSSSAAPRAAPPST